MLFDDLASDPTLFSMLAGGSGNDGSGNLGNSGEVSLEKKLGKEILRVLKLLSLKRYKPPHTQITRMSTEAIIMGLLLLSLLLLSDE